MLHGREAREVAVERDDFTGVLRGDRREDCIGDEIAGCIGFLAESPQQREMPRSGTDGEMRGLGAHGVDEGERFGAGRGHLEDPSVGGQPQERAPHDRWDREALLSRQYRVEPASHGLVVRMVAAMGREHDVDVQQEHCSATLVELDAFVEQLQQRSVRVEVDARARPGAALEDGDPRSLR
jgi:hypothetical protein